MSASKFEYSIESFFLGKWTKIISNRTLQYCQGYHDGVSGGPTPRLALRVVRSDGKVMENTEAKDDVSIGMVAGWPTAGQYEAAAARALEQAAAIRRRAQEKEERDARRRQ